MFSSVTVAGPMGTCTGLTIFKNWILSVHTFLRKSSKTLIVNCSPGQRRYPKPNGANPAWSHTGGRLAIDNAVDRTKPTVMQHDAPTVSDIKCRSLKRTPDKADLLAGTLIDLVACRYRVVAIGVELLVIFPMYLIEVDRVGTQQVGRPFMS